MFDQWYKNSASFSYVDLLVCASWKADAVVPELCDEKTASP